MNSVFIFKVNITVLEKRNGRWGLRLQEAKLLETKLHLQRRGSGIENFSLEISIG